MIAQTKPCATKEEALEKARLLADQMLSEKSDKQSKSPRIEVIFHPYAKWRKQWLAEVEIEET